MRSILEGLEIKSLTTTNAGPIKAETFTRKTETKTPESEQLD